MPRPFLIFLCLLLPAGCVSAGDGTSTSAPARPSASSPGVLPRVLQISGDMQFAKVGERLKLNAKADPPEVYVTFRVEEGPAGARVLNGHTLISENPGAVKIFAAAGPQPAPTNGVLPAGPTTSFVVPVVDDPPPTQPLPSADVAGPRPGWTMPPLPLTLQTAEEWQAFWQSAHDGAEVPAVDFARQNVVVYQSVYNGPAGKTVPTHVENGELKFAVASEPAYQRPYAGNLLTVIHYDTVNKPVKTP